MTLAVGATNLLLTNYPKSILSANALRNCKRAYITRNEVQCAEVERGMEPERLVTRVLLNQVYLEIGVC